MFREGVFKYSITCRTCGFRYPSAVSLTMSPKYPDGVIYRGVWFGHHFPLGRPIDEFMKDHFGHNFLLEAEKK